MQLFSFSFSSSRVRVPARVILFRLFEYIYILRVLCAFKFLKICTSLDLNFGGKILRRERRPCAENNGVDSIRVVVTRYNRARTNLLCMFK